MMHCSDLEVGWFHWVWLKVFLPHCNCDHLGVKLAGRRKELMQQSNID